MLTVEWRVNEDQPVIDMNWTSSDRFPAEKWAMTGEGPGQWITLPKSDDHTGSGYKCRFAAKQNYLNNPRIQRYRMLQILTSNATFSGNHTTKIGEQHLAFRVSFDLSSIQFMQKQQWEIAAEFCNLTLDYP